jgi:anti-anti-sigma factor
MSAGDGFTVSSHTDDGVTVIVVTGDLDLATAPDLQAECDKAVAEKPSEIRLDLSALTFIDSSGISVLVKTHHELAEAGAKLVLHQIDDRTRRVLDVAGLADFFERSDQPA